MIGSMMAAADAAPVSNAGETAVFWVCGGMALLGAFGMLLSRKAVHSALFVAMTMINLAVLYVSEGAVFLGMVQVIVYTGAVMMLFLFVLMLVGVDSSDSTVETIKGQRPLAVIAAVLFGGILISAVSVGLAGVQAAGLEDANAADGGNIQGLARLIFTRYLLGFEATSALLITAALGAMVLTHREPLHPRKSQRERSVERFNGERHPGNLPSPGVYAHSNAVNVPALLPDGTMEPESVPGPMRVRGSVRRPERSALVEAQRLERHEPVTAAEARSDGEIG